MTIGNKIKRARKYMNMTQQELGLAIGFPPESAHVRITQYETGKRIPRDDVLENLARALQVPLQYFYRPIPLSETSNTPAFLFSMEQDSSFTLLPASAVGELSDTDILIHVEDPEDQEFLRQWMYMRRSVQDGYIDEESYFRWQMGVLSSSGRKKE